MLNLTDALPSETARRLANELEQAMVEATGSGLDMAAYLIQMALTQLQRDAVERPPLGKQFSP